MNPIAWLQVVVAGCQLVMLFFMFWAARDIERQSEQLLKAIRESRELDKDWRPEHDA